MVLFLPENTSRIHSPASIAVDAGVWRISGLQILSRGDMYHCLQKAVKIHVLSLHSLSPSSYFMQKIKKKKKEQQWQQPLKMIKPQKREKNILFLYSSTANHTGFCYLKNKYWLISDTESFKLFVIAINICWSKEKMIQQWNANVKYPKIFSNRCS